MEKAFKESHSKDLEKLTVDCLCEIEKKSTDNTVNTSKHVCSHHTEGHYSLRYNSSETLLDPRFKTYKLCIQNSVLFV
jgi:hypothetical protein